MNLVAINQAKEDSINPLTTIEIRDTTTQHKPKIAGHSTQLVENTKVLCKDGKMVMPKCPQFRAVAWFHHYLQHPGRKSLKETLWLMYWKGLRMTVQSHVKKCYSCQVNKRKQHKYGKLLAKLANTNP